MPRITRSLSHIGKHGSHIYFTTKMHLWHVLIHILRIRHVLGRRCVVRYVLGLRYVIRRSVKRATDQLRKSTIVEFYL